MGATCLIVAEIETLFGGMEEEDPTAIMWRPLDNAGNYLPRTAVTQWYSDGTTDVRLYEQTSDNTFLIVHHFLVESKADAGLWARWWCNWDLEPREEVA